MTTRRLAAILAADVAGFSAMMERDEERTFARVRALRSELVEPALNEHQGRLVKTTGDGFLAEFVSPVQAVRAAIAIQERLADGGGDDTPVRLRIGINLGDIMIEEGGDIYGDGVNVAVRLEQLAVPGGVLVSEDIHRQVSGKLDRSFEDLGEQRVKGIARPIRAFALTGASGGRVDSKTLPLPDKPSVAVLPFTNLSRDPDQDYFCDGLVEDIIAGLSHVRWLFVIGRNSSFSYRESKLNLKVVGRELGVRYVLNGSIRRAGERIRVVAQLFEAETGHNVWAERYDGLLPDVFNLQDEITNNVVGAIEPSLLDAERTRSQRKPPASMSAWDHVTRAMPHVWAWAETESDYAIRELQKAIERDPQYGHAHSLLAWIHAARTTMGWSGSEDSLAIARDAAHRAISLDSDDAWGHLSLGYLDMIVRNSREAYSALGEAVRRNPSFALAHAVLGCAYACGGEGDTGITHSKIAQRLSPRDPHMAFFLSIEGLCHFVEHRYEASADLNRRALQQRPNHAGALRSLAAACVLLGEMREAQQRVREAIRVQPGLTATWLESNHPLSRPEDRTMYIGALREAGLPE
jgi:adenylate cyclase